ncbi:MAG TPA: hypothetical protein VG097_11610 [Gemmata sp.]|jgi:hypothetical protein|nr:hypothetical protein [Gemmata sp.]
MAIRWGAPVLAVGMVALAASVPAIGGYFGATNYSASSPPNCCAQTHFVLACDDVRLQPEGCVAPVGLKPVEQLIVIDEQPKLSPLVPLNTDLPIPEAIAISNPENASGSGQQTHLVYETVLRPVSETIFTPVTETVMKESRTIVSEKVNETQYKEYTVNVQKRVCEPIVQKQCYVISKPVCETVYRESSRKVCKTVTETLFKECPKTVCKPVTETVMRDTTRIVFTEVNETVTREVCKKVQETVTCNRLVTKVVPETVCENFCVRGHLAWKEVPKYECAFDPCSCAIVQKQVGTVRRLIREPAQTLTRQVTRNKTIVEQVPETKVVQRLVFEKVPVTVTKKVPSRICEKVPVTVTRNVSSTQLVKVPYTVTRKVQSIEVVKVPVTIHRRALGAYVDFASLSAGLTEVAKTAERVEFVHGGTAALCNPNAAIYETGGRGRVFVEGLRGTRTVTHYETKTIQTTEMRKVPCQVARIVKREVVKKVPVTETRMVPSTVTRMVPCATCRIVMGDVAKACPEVVANCQPTVILPEPCQPRSKMARFFSAMTPRTLHRLSVPVCEQNCGAQCSLTGECRLGFGPRIRCRLSACGSCETPSRCYSCRLWLRSFFNKPTCPHPNRDFFGSILSHRAACSSCQSTPCGPATPNADRAQPPSPQKSPPTTLPPLPLD